MLKKNVFWILNVLKIINDLYFKKFYKYNFSKIPKILVKITLRKGKHLDPVT